MHIFSPSSLRDFKGNDENIQKGRAFMTDDRQNYLIVSSPSGYGKTTFCQLLFAEYKNIHIIRPYYECFSNHHDFVEYIEALCSSYFHRHQVKILFFDDVDVFLNTNHQGYSYLKDLWRQKLENVKVVVSCLQKEEHKIRDLRKSKKTRYLHLNPPCIYEIKEILRACFPRDQLETRLDINNIIDIFQGNLRQILHVCASQLYDHQDHFLSRHITRICADVLKNANDWESAVSLEPKMLHLMLYENVREYVCTYNLPCSLFLHIYQNNIAHVMQSFIFGAIWEKNCFDTLSFEHFEKICYIASGYVLHFCHLFREKKRKIKIIRRNSQNVAVREKNQNLPIKYSVIPTRHMQYCFQRKKQMEMACQYDVTEDTLLFMGEVYFELQRENHKNGVLQNICRHVCSRDRKVYRCRIQRYG